MKKEVITTGVKVLICDLSVHRISKIHQLETEGQSAAVHVRDCHKGPWNSDCSYR